MSNEDREKRLKALEDFAFNIDKIVKQPESVNEEKRRKSDESRKVSPPIQAGEVFRDRLRCGGEGPEMVVLPTGRFRMGHLLDGIGIGHARPVHTVTISRRIAMGQYPVTFEDYDRFVMATGAERPEDEGWGRDRMPVINVRWHDAKAYAAWLSEQTGKRYRLPSESEWEYAARAGTETLYSWGDEIGVNRTNCKGSGSKWSDRQTSPVGSFEPNAFGLFDMHGNVCEWLEDCWHDNYEGAPSDGSAWTSGGRGDHRVLRGGAWNYHPRCLYAVDRYFMFKPLFFCNFFGFRLVQDLNPIDKIVKQPGPVSEEKHREADESRNVSPPIQSVEVFRDRLRSGGEGPAMVVLPPGRFRMGDLDGSGDSGERPVHTVTISRRIAMGQYPVTFEDYDLYVSAMGDEDRGFLKTLFGKKPKEPERPGDAGWGRGRRPVINVNWHEAKAYAAWLSEQTGKRYRLPSESEWEYAARAGTETAYSWGDEIGVNRANCEDSGSEWSGKQTSPVGSFAPNGFGLYDMHGNVRNIVEDCWHDNYEGAPSDGSAWTSGGDSDKDVSRGGAWCIISSGLRCAARGRGPRSLRNGSCGFRLVQDLNP